MSYSRILNIVGYITVLITSMQVGGAFDLLPPKVSAVLLAVGATLSAFTERVQGGKSTE